MPVYAAVFGIMTMSSIGLPLLNGFIGELLILVGVFARNKVWAALAASGIVLGAAYMLWLFQRTMFGKVDNPKNQNLKDLSMREFATFAPLILLAFWIGIYPSPFIRRLDTSVSHVMARVSPEYGQQNAANQPCATPEQLKAAEARIVTTPVSTKGEAPSLDSFVVKGCDDAAGQRGSAPNAQRPAPTPKTQGGVH
jgi:NADH-quinone oxidoreductase subunit M